MDVIVSLRDVINEMDVFSDEHTAYVNRKTGDLITLTHDELALAEDPETAEDAPQWQQELLHQGARGAGVRGLSPSPQ